MRRSHVILIIDDRVLRFIRSTIKSYSIS